MQFHIPVLLNTPHFLFFPSKILLFYSEYVSNIPYSQGTLSNRVLKIFIWFELVFFDNKRESVSRII